MRNELEKELLEFENTFDIYDTEERTIEDIKNELKDSNSIKETINYYNQILNSENDELSEINIKLKQLIDNWSLFYWKETYSRRIKCFKESSKLF